MQEIKLYLPLTSFCNCPCIPDVIITFPFIAYNIICFRYAVDDLLSYDCQADLPTLHHIM